MSFEVNKNYYRFKIDEKDHTFTVEESSKKPKGKHVALENLEAMKRIINENFVYVGEDEKWADKSPEGIYTNIREAAETIRRNFKAKYKEAWFSFFNKKLKTNVKSTADYIITKHSDLTCAKEKLVKNERMVLRDLVKLRILSKDDLVYTKSGLFRTKRIDTGATFAKINNLEKKLDILTNKKLYDLPNFRYFTNKIQFSNKTVIPSDIAEELLHLGSQHGDMKLIDLALKQNVNINSLNDEGNTALAIAWNNGNRNIVVKLLYNPDLNLHELIEVPKFGLISPLQLAVHYQEPELVEQLLNNPKFTGDFQGEEGVFPSPLLMAIQTKQTKIIDILLKKLSLSDIDVQDEEDKTALHYATENGDLYTVQKLVEKGADLNIHNSDGHTPLSLALQRKQFDIFKYLIAQSDVEVDFFASFDKDLSTKPPTDIITTPLGYALRQADRNSFLPEYQKDVIPALQARAAKLDFWDQKEDHISPLELAMRDLSEDNMVILLKANTTLDLNTPYRLGNTPLYLAILSAKPKVVRYLLDKEADSSIKNRDKQTAKELVLKERNDTFALAKKSTIPIKSKQKKPKSGDIKRAMLSKDIRDRESKLKEILNMLDT